MRSSQISCTYATVGYNCPYFFWNNYKCYLWGDVNAFELIDNEEVVNELDVLLVWVLNININQKDFIIRYQVALEFEPPAGIGNCMKSNCCAWQWLPSAICFKTASWHWKIIKAVSSVLFKLCYEGRNWATAECCIKGWYLLY